MIAGMVASPAAVADRHAQGDEVFGIERTIALELCERHAEALRDVVVVLETV